MIIFALCPFFGNSQDRVEDEINFSSYKWLVGEWQGRGFGNPNFKQPSLSVVNSESQNFKFMVNLNRDSTISIVLIGENGKRANISYFIDEIPSHIHEDRMSRKDVRLLFMGPGRNEGDGRYFDIEILINRITDNNINLKMTYYARTDKLKLILHGAFKRVIQTKN
jgi:hypothetical protein